MRLIPCFLLFLAISIAQPLTAAAFEDLTVGWISREPRIDYVWDSANPARDGWPQEGQAVQWQAHVRNWSSSPRTGVSYRWLVNGVEVETGRVDLPAGAETVVELSWHWRFARDLISFEIDSEREIAEVEERNNRLTIHSDTVTVGLYVEQSFYDHFAGNQLQLNAGSSCFENWAQRHIERFNEMAALAIYEETPVGVLDRWRIDAIVVVPDGSLPLVPIPGYREKDGEPNEKTHPNSADRSVDMQWGFTADDVRNYGNLTLRSESNPFYLAGALLHELAHARYLIDVYAFDVRHGISGDSIDILEEGKPVVGTEAMPLTGPYAFFTPELGLMNRHFSFIDRYSAIAMNRIAGHRATRGNYNEPENIGSFMNDLPEENRLTLRTVQGEVLPFAQVEIFQSEGAPGFWFSKQYDNVPDLILHTDAEGRVLVGRSPFSADGVIVHTWEHSNAVAIVRVTTGDRSFYGFLESRLFNLAYWRGETELADHEVTVGGRSCPLAFLHIELLRPAFAGSTSSHTVRLEWTPPPAAVRQRVWASFDGARPRILALVAGNVSTAEVKVAGRVLWWVEAEFDSCPAFRSATGRFAAPPSSRRRPAAHPRDSSAIGAMDSMPSFDSRRVSGGRSR